MKLYYAPGACSLSPHIALCEAGLSFDLEKVDLGSKKTETGKDFYTISPNGYVPALEIAPGDVLTEGPAIVQYVADLVPAKQLAPANGTRERYALQSWLNFVTAELHKGYGPLFNGAMPKEGKAVVKEKLELRFTALNKQMAGKDYLMGSTFTVADGYLFVMMTWAGYANVDLAQWSALTAFRDRVAARPAVQAAMKAEGLIK